ncbi:BREX system P-loop protein BrxC [Roseomonas sp. PWR1]|uniref:BREX system P-loop protein BrxC n=1 Tax=Roseomonas nitratireducens TaxID=2820810 RepID=A0ABS4AR92_9PROT|nr:BREX system P-loop protein BrxC [Neoroseomonas nitratireducens]MBP0463878.1 BREX system P-loop protein BrxC [Neoroseomonas nitratireducens]
MITLRDIFEKPVDRAIEGVIKADDEASLKVELEEYVITNEIERQFEKFLDAYNNYGTANGVWISGFFGSGKSHLLKMLALLLENRDIGGSPAYEVFKQKCAHNEILAADLRKAVSIPSKSILFNIDQKADVISKGQTDALLSVFQKVFDEVGGYYGKQPHIAQFERDLDSREVLEAFRAAYQAVAGKPWERGREQALLENANVAKAYAQATGANPSEGEGILTRYRQDFRSSIEDFAEKVRAYIESQKPGFRLNFFVDEVGQYIADNVKLMTNLQTIAESLNTKCRGRAWIIVTAQQDMASVIGDMNQRQENDFSKIQARFANRMPLNSADVAEVIQKRLLKKTESGITSLSDLYHRESNNLKTLFDFTDGSIRLENFRDRDHFIHSYPFVPYQYPLFQLAIQNLSQHNAFEGKHSSVGERSMLGVFQEVAVRLAELPLGGLATFDQMFEGIRTALKSNVQQSILIAEKNLGDEFATRILKALFLVKYVKGFKPTARNVAVLMLDRFDTDLTKHKRRVDEALSLLEQNTYIQRNSELFEFLTDEEKDVEQEIKAIEVDTAEIAKELETLIFDGVIKSRKLKHEASSQDYAFARYLDDRLLGRDYELAINVITPFHEQSGNAEATAMRTMSRDELAIVLNADNRFVSDLMTFKRTDKYVRQARSVTQQASIERIVREKGEQNNSRQRDLALKARALVGDARLFVRGEEIEVRSEDAQARVERAFQTLVDKVHVNLGMLRGAAYSDNEIGRFLTHGNDGMFGEDAANLTEAEQEILNFAQSNARNGIRTTVKAVVERFERKPYGWSYAAILCTTASLLGRGKIEARSDGSPLEGDALLRGLQNAHALGNIVLELQVEFTPAQTRKLKEFFREFFDAQPAGTEGKALGIETAEAFGTLKTELAVLEGQSSRYPFLSALGQLQDALREVTGKPYAWYLQELGRHEDRLLDLKEGILDPIRRFMGGGQKAIYDEARSYLADQNANFGYGGEDQARAIQEVLVDPNCFKGNAIQQIKGTLDTLRAEVDHRLAAERKTAISDVEELRAKLRALPEFASLTEPDRREIEAAFTNVLDTIGTSKLIAVIRERVSGFRASGYPTLLGRVTAPPSAKKDGDDDKPGGFSDSSSGAPAAQTQPEYVAASALRVTYAKAYLADERDIDAYLETLRETLISEIRSGKRVTV